MYKPGTIKEEERRFFQMFQSTLEPRMTFQQKMRLPVYQILYRNVRNRLCGHAEHLEYDFFTVAHQDEEAMIQLYRERPTAYYCTARASLTHPGGEETMYLVVGGGDRAVLLLEPEWAMMRNLPFLSVLEGSFFRPCLESANEYWQMHIEPFACRTENVLHSAAKVEAAPRALFDY